jgi:hypothetical protein
MHHLANSRVWPPDPGLQVDAEALKQDIEDMALVLAHDVHKGK